MDISKEHVFEVLQFHTSVKTLQEICWTQYEADKGGGEDCTREPIENKKRPSEMDYIDVQKNNNIFEKHVNSLYENMDAAFQTLWIQLEEDKGGGDKNTTEVRKISLTPTIPIEQIENPDYQDLWQDNQDKLKFVTQLTSSSS